MSVEFTLHIMTMPDAVLGTFRGGFAPSTQEAWDDAYATVGESPSLWIGDCTFWGDDSTIPGPVKRVSDLVWEPAVLTVDLKDAIVAALDGSNDANPYYRTIVGDGAPDDMTRAQKAAETFLRRYLGYRIFAVAW